MSTTPSARRTLRYCRSRSNEKRVAEGTWRCEKGCDPQGGENHEFVGPGMVVNHGFSCVIVIVYDLVNPG